MEGCNIVQEVVTNTTPRERKTGMKSGYLMRPYKQLRKEEKQKAKEKGKIYQLNAESQRITRRDRKAFLSKQCKEIDKNNRMGKTRENWR